MTPGSDVPPPLLGSSGTTKGLVVFHGQPWGPRADVTPQVQGKRRWPCSCAKFKRGDGVGPSILRAQVQPHQREAEASRCPVWEAHPLGDPHPTEGDII